MAEVDYDFKTPAGLLRGAAIWAAGLIKEPGTGDSTSATAVRNAIERLAELVYYVGTGAADVMVDKITGNGEPPSTGYTPTTRPIIIKGTQGLRVDNSELNFTAGSEVSGEYENSAEVTYTGPTIRLGSNDAWVAERVQTQAGNATPTVVGTSYDTLLINRAVGNVTATLEDSPAPMDGVKITIWTENDGAGNTLVVKRETGAVTIATYPADTHASVTYQYRDAWGGWRAIMWAGVTLGTP